jgi:hypothetical protein
MASFPFNPQQGIHYTELRCRDRLRALQTSETDARPACVRRHSKQESPAPQRRRRACDFPKVMKAGCLQFGSSLLQRASRVCASWRGSAR